MSIDASLAILGKIVAIGTAALAKEITGWLHVMPVQQQGLTASILPDLAIATDVTAMVTIARETIMASAASS